MFIFYTTCKKNGLSISKFKRHIMESCLLLGTWFYEFISPSFMDSEYRNLFMLIFSGGQRIMQWFWFLKFMLDSDSHKLFFILFWTANIPFIFFKTWICLLNICFLFYDGVCIFPPNVLLFLFNSFCLGNINKILI